VAIAFQPAKLTACCRRMKSRPQSDPCKPPRCSHMGRGTVQAGPGVWGGQPCFKQWPRPQARTDSRAERGAAPKGARSQPGGRSRKGACGNWAQARQPAKRGAEGAACGQGGNAPGCDVPPGVRERARHHAERPTVNGGYPLRVRRFT
jgi:hypothetical protein